MRTDRGRREPETLALYNAGEEKKGRRRRGGLELSSMALHVIGLIFLAAGGLSAVLRARFFNVGDTGGISGSALLSLLDDPDNFALATATVICQMAELCAIPIFAFLLTEGAVKTSDFKNYMLRVLGLALLCEVPYSLLWNGAFFLAWSHNIVFGTLMAMVMLWFFKTWPGRTAGNILVKVLAVLGCFLWCNFLGFDHGAAMIVITAALWTGRGGPNVQILAGFVACVCGVILTPLYLFSALGLLFVHLYGGQKGRYNRYVVYFAYPILLAICCVGGIV